MSWLHKISQSNTEEFKEFFIRNLDLPGLNKDYWIVNDSKKQLNIALADILVPYINNKTELFKKYMLNPGLRFKLYITQPRGIDIALFFGDEKIGLPVSSVMNVASRQGVFFRTQPPKLYRLSNA